MAVATTTARNGAPEPDAAGQDLLGRFAERAADSTSSAPRSGGAGSSSIQVHTSRISFMR